jgi:hypothetical protein
MRWRAIEETDATGEIIAQEQRRKATAATRNDLSAEGKMDVVERNGFLASRGRWLDEQVAREGTEAARMKERLAAPDLGWMWKLPGWLLALVAGYVFSGLGQDRDINLLALPLMGILAWNAAMVIAGLFHVLFPDSRRGDSHGFVALIAPWFQKKDAKAGGNTAPCPVKFQSLAGRAMVERFRSRVLAWLHVAAAIFAIGGVAGMYAKGWSKEYRAVWESTILNETGVQSFFGALYGPASRVFGQPLPVEELPLMHRVDGVAEAPGAALPWINLYAGTILLFVVVPRLLLAGFTPLRGDQAAARMAEDAAHGWDAYARKLLRSVEGGGDEIEILVSGNGSRDGDKDRWVESLQTRLGGLLQARFAAIPPGDEDDFVAGWQPRSPLCALVFHLAVTPEVEVQQRLVNDLSTRLHDCLADGRVIIVLDAATARERWPAERVKGHEALWRKCLAPCEADVMICG